MPLPEKSIWREGPFYDQKHGFRKNVKEMPNLIRDPLGNAPKVEVPAEPLGCAQRVVENIWEIF
jgi:hypothetical protein